MGKGENGKNERLVSAMANKSIAVLSLFPLFPLFLFSSSYTELQRAK
jgi:hypothetical protein